MRTSLEEREITLALKKLLSEKSWHILSIHFPGAQGGLSISTYGKTRGWVPDLVALKKGVLLTVESKPAYVKEDVDKLNALYEDSKVLDKLKSKLNLKEKVVCQKSIAYYVTSSNQINLPSGFVVFVVDGNSTFSVLLGEKIPPVVKSIFMS